MIAHGSDATNVYSLSKYPVISPAYSSMSGVYLSPTRYAISDKRQYFSSEVSLIGPTTDNALRDLALKRLKSKLSGRVGNSSVLAPVVELRELRKTIVAMAEISLEFAFHLMTLRKKYKGRKLKRLFSNAWLTFSFGVSPLVNDIQSISLSIEDYLNRKDNNVRVRAKASKDWVTSAIFDVDSMPGFTASSSVRVSHHLTYTYSGAAALNLKSANNYGISQHFALGAENLPGVAWELAPFSWLFDYFSTVGAYLNDTFVLPPGSLKYLTLSRLYKCEIDTFPYYRPIDKKKAWTTSFTSFPGRLEFVNFDRSSVTTLPTRSLRFKSIDEIGSGAVNKLLNLLSIILK